MTKILAALLLATSPSLATANTYIATFEGVLRDGYDNANLFNLGGEPLLGKSFKLVATVSAPVTGGLIYSDGSHATYSGNSYYGFTGLNPVSATLTINGRETSIESDAINSRSGDITFFNELQGQSGMEDGLSVGYSNFKYATSGPDRYEFFEYFNISALVSSVDIFDSLLPTDGVSHTQDHNDYPYWLDTGGGSFELLYDGNRSYGTLQTDRFSLQIAPVPEPGEWAMMLGGLAIVGGVARRRKS